MSICAELNAITDLIGMAAMLMLSTNRSVDIDHDESVTHHANEVHRWDQELGYFCCPAPNCGIPLFSL